jgi:uncharacterized protein YecT (DUF1311 family)
MMRVIGLCGLILGASSLEAVAEATSVDKPRIVNEAVVRKLCPDPNKKCMARDNPGFYKINDPAFYNRITKPAPRNADPCKSATTQRDMNECYHRVQVAAEAQVTELYETLISKASTDDLRTLLRASQEAWASYRNRQCEMEAFGVLGGSVHPTITALCMTNKAKARKVELDRLTKCAEGDLSCPFHFQ